MTLTLGQRKWLTKLKDEGRQRRDRYCGSPPTICIVRGWTEWVWVDNNTGHSVYISNRLGHSRKDLYHLEEQLTQEGSRILESPRV